jgi:hypothetical protein
MNIVRFLKTVSGVQRSTAVSASDPLPTTVGNSTPVGYQKITSLSSATALTVPTGARIALMIPEGQAVRWRDDGTDPVAATGMPIAVGQPFRYTGTLSAFKVIEQAASATLHVYYYK